MITAPDCIEWTKARHVQGYGHKWHDGKVWRVHRLVMLELHVPIAGMVVMHCRVCSRAAQRRYMQRKNQEASCN